MAESRTISNASNSAYLKNLPSSLESDAQSNHTDSSAESEEDERDIDGIKYAQTKILNPTSVLLTMKSEGKFKKFRLSEISVDIATLFLSLDFKDVDFMYYLFCIYQNTTVPTL